MTTENNVAAQAGDEPMQAAFEAWARDPQRSGKLPLDRWTTNGGYKDSRTYIAFYGWRSALASQVSPRATADVERYSIDEICQASVKAGLGILECNSLIVTLKGA